MVRFSASPKLRLSEVSGQVLKPTKPYVPWLAEAILRGNAVAHLVEALRYKLEGRGFDSRWCHRNFSLT